MKNVISTIGVLIVNQGKVLLVKHTKKADHLTNTYGIPAGRLEKDETEVEGAIRELQEEAGLKTNKESLTPLPTRYKATIQRKDGLKNFSLKVFVCDSYSGSITKSSESNPEWILLSKIKQKNLLPSIERIIRDGVKLIEVPDKVH